MNIDKNIPNTYPENLYELARNGKLSHAVIIECADSAEAYDTALKVVKNALCTESECSPCEKCGNCLKVINNSHPDVKTICPQGSTKSIKIDDIRFIRQDAYIISNEGSYKFYIITDADYLTVQAQNALIKILEEPPEKVMFIILCKSSLSLLETIRSRSQIFRNNDEAIKEADAKRKNLAENIMSASLKNNKCEIIKFISLIPNDRIFLKNLINDIIENFLKAYAFENDFDKDSENLINIIDELKYIASLVDKNINFNLITCYISACL